MRRLLVLKRAVGALALLNATLGCVARGTPESRSRLAAPSSRSLEVVGRSDLGGGGLNGSIAIVGSTAVVAAGITPAAGVHTHFYNPYPCSAIAVKLVDLSAPARPVVTATIPLPAGVAASDVAALRVSGTSFRGDLVAIALAQCNLAGSYTERGVVYYDVTDPARPRFLGRYAADADSVHPPETPPCGPLPAGSGRRCASSQHSIALVSRPDGRVLSLSTEPGASASRFPSGDLRIVDVTDPRQPSQIGFFPERGETINSTNGCRPFSAGHAATPYAGGTRALVAWFDGGVRVVDLGVPASPRELEGFKYAATRSIEGNAAYIAAGTVDGRELALLSEEDWIAPRTMLRIEAPTSLIGSHIACEAMFTLFAPGDDVALYRVSPSQVISGEIAYVGRGCPENPGDGMHAGTRSTDPYLADPRGKIALVDRTAHPIQRGISSGAGCAVAERVKRAQAAGALAVLVAQTVAAAPLAFSSDGDPTGLTIPAAQIDKGIADTLRTTLCASLDENGRCLGVAVRGVLRDTAGEWGALRVLELPATGGGAPRELWHHRTESARLFPPRDLGVHAPHRAVVSAGRGYVAWNSDGLRVLDLRDGAREIGFFVPADTRDPAGLLPAKSYVVGVAVLSLGGVEYIVISDVNSGLYVLR
ncbi:MAG: PA domain-containing protein [Gemmatimonadaceae bacterium]